MGKKGRKEYPEGITAMTSLASQNGMLVNKNFIGLLAELGLDSPESIQAFQGGLLIKKKSLRTVVKVQCRERTVYLKRHLRTGKELLKSLLPWTGQEDARNEWKNILLLEQYGFSTMTPVAFGEKKRFGLPFFSFTITEELRDAEKLETFFPREFAPPPDSGKIIEKRVLIRKTGQLLRDFHARGFNHQDFYLGHLFIQSGDRTLFIADLQRMHRRSTVRQRDMIKDCAQLLYSCTQTGVFSRADCMRLAHAYFGKTGWSREDKAVMKRILAKAKKISRHDAKLRMGKADRLS